MPLSNLQRGTHSAGGEVLDWSYYDTETVSHSTTTNNLFQLSLGQGTPPKTLELTNMTINAQIPTGQRLSVHRIKLFYATHSTFNTAKVLQFYKLLTTSTLEFLIPGKDSLLNMTLHELMGVSTLTALTPTTAGDNIPIIQPRFNGVYPLQKAIILAEQTPFSLRITHQDASALTDNTNGLDGDFIKLSLNGILERRS
jgi:hypothetical protein